jgi:signal transduction histidine kinase
MAVREERTRIARELHDGLLQDAMTIALHLRAVLCSEDHFGLMGMRERAHNVHGRLDIRSSHRHGHDGHARRAILERVISRGGGQR